jgi:aspartate/glutamate racemase
MTTVGIVGGLGPESTIDYYRRILEAWERNDSSTAPSIVIDSLDVRRVKGEFRDDTREQFISLVSRLQDDERIDGVILGGTELPLLLSTPVIAEVPALDTTALHVAAIVRRLRQASALPSGGHPPAS